MAVTGALEVLFLHALPLDGRMWDRQRARMPGVTHAPTLYGLGDSIKAWAAAAWTMVASDRVVLVGCSVGGSCAIDMAIAAPDRVAALLLIGTKAGHRPDPQMHAEVLATLRDGGMATAWPAFWAPLFSSRTDAAVVEGARRIALDQPLQDVARGVSVFHRRPDRSRSLSDLACPVVIVTGGDDPAPGLRISAAQARAARQGRLQLIADCGHYVPLEQPGRLGSILDGLIAAL